MSLAAVLATTNDTNPRQRGGLGIVASLVATLLAVTVGVATPANPNGVSGVSWWHGVASVIMNDTPMAANDRHDAVGVNGLLLANGRTTQLPTPAGATFIQTFSINNRTQVVGYTDFTAFLWDHGAMIELSSLAGSTASAYDINDAGRIVGSSATTVDGLNPHAVVWLHT